jgi:hypothetical protein
MFVFSLNYILSQSKRYTEKGKKSGGCHLKNLLMTSLLGYDELST